MYSDAFNIVLNVVNDKDSSTSKDMQEDEEELSAELFRNLTKEFLVQAVTTTSLAKIVPVPTSHYGGQGCEHWAYIRKTITAQDLVDYFSFYLQKKSDDNLYLTAQFILDDYKELKKNTILFFEVKPKLGLDAYDSVKTKYTKEQIKTFIREQGFLVEAVRVIIVYQELFLPNDNIKDLGLSKIDDSLDFQIIGHVQAKMKGLFQKIYNLVDNSYSCLYNKLHAAETQILKLSAEKEKLVLETRN